MVFMGNEFGHPDWIEFPSAENNHSFDKSRRLWGLPQDSSLKFKELQDFSISLNAFIEKHGADLYGGFPLLLKSGASQLSVKRGSFRVDVDFEHIRSATRASLAVQRNAACFYVI